ncbi:hypothetical protein SAY87_029950 [Trapa incisa]|uniref:RING-type E3 ubiquitin transferase n=1 Tax=Trapa incisa TaxID=236973 RepID=A0AAN7KDQ7_9MYRT|nr:hypothetical protein SAY87_029950 [Trapa incisa]
MVLHQFKLTATVRRRLNEDDIPSREEDEGLILFEIFYENLSLMAAIRVCPQDEREKLFGLMIDEQCMKKMASRCFRRSELMNSDNLVAAKRSLASLAITLVPRRLWAEEMGKQLAWVASHVDNRLRGDLGVEPLAAAPLLVKVNLVTTTLIKPEETSDPRLVTTLEYLGSEARTYTPLVYEPATLSSIGALATIPPECLEAGDQCAICMDEYDGDGSSSEEEGVVMMPCSHKYHSRCLFKWLKMNHVCPMCRFRLPHDVFAICETKI